MKHNTALIVLSVLNAFLFGLHLTGDIVFGIEEGGREILVGVLILAVYLYGASGSPNGWPATLFCCWADALRQGYRSCTRWEGPSASDSLSCREASSLSGRCSRCGRRGSLHSSCPYRQSGAYGSADVPDSVSLLQYHATSDLSPVANPRAETTCVVVYESCHR